MKQFWRETPAWLFLLATFGVALWIQFDGQEEIPLHFDVRGEVDRRGDTWTALLLPAIALVLYGLLTWVQRHPRRCNYPVEITDENREQAYRQMSRIVYRIKVLVMALFLYLTLGVAQLEEISPFLILAIALAVPFIIVTGWSQMSKNK